MWYRLLLYATNVYSALHWHFTGEHCMFNSQDNKDGEGGYHSVCAEACGSGVRQIQGCQRMMTHDLVPGGYLF